MKSGGLNPEHFLSGSAKASLNVAKQKNLVQQLQQQKLVSQQIHTHTKYIDIPSGYHLMTFNCNLYVGNMRPFKIY